MPSRLRHLALRQSIAPSASLWFLLTILLRGFMVMSIPQSQLLGAKTINRYYLTILTVTLPKRFPL